MNIVGIRYIVLAFSRATPEEARYQSLDEVRAGFRGLCGKEKLDEAVEYCNSLVQRQEDRSETIESKAITLLGVTGIATGFITGSAGFLLDTDKITSISMSVVVAVLFALIVASLLLTTLLAARVVKIGEYVFTYPAASDILALSNDTIENVKLERAASLLFSFEKNTKVVDEKADFLVGAQLWFRNTTVLLLALASCLALYMLLRGAGLAC